MKLIIPDSQLFKHHKFKKIGRIESKIKGCNNSVN